MTTRFAAQEDILDLALAPARGGVFAHSSPFAHGAFGGSTGPHIASDQTGTPDDDDLTGTPHGENFDMSQGGNDTVHARGGDDTIQFGATLTADDRADGGDGLDRVYLEGDYSSGLVLADTTIQNVEQIILAGAFTYHLTLADGNIASGQSLSIDARTLSGGNVLVLDASSEADAQIVVNDSLGDDIVQGGGGNDFIALSTGADTIFGGDGDDEFIFSGTYSALDHVYGGDGFDDLFIEYGGDHLIFGPHNARSIESLSFDRGSFSVTLKDAFVAAGETERINFSTGGTADFDGHREKDGNLTIDAFGMSGVHLVAGRGDDTFNVDLSGSNTYLQGGAGNDTAAFASAPGPLHIDLSAGGSGGLTLVSIESLVGSTFDDVLIGDAGDNSLTGVTGNDALYGADGNDVISGSAGADSLFGGRGADAFRYSSVSHSTGAAHDTIGDFNGVHDTFLVTATPTDIDSHVFEGSVSTASFDSDLAAALAGKLGAQHAVLITPDGGDFAGKTLLVVDVNGSAAYESGSDLVIELDHARHVDALSTDSFALLN